MELCFNKVPIFFMYAFILIAVVLSALDAKYWKLFNQKNVSIWLLVCKSHAESKLSGIRYTAKIIHGVCNKTLSFSYTFLFTF